MKTAPTLFVKHCLWKRLGERHHYVCAYSGSGHDPHRAQRNQITAWSPAIKKDGGCRRPFLETPFQLR
jgi:hypothetical protein